MKGPVKTGTDRRPRRRSKYARISEALELVREVERNVVRRSELAQALLVISAGAAPVAL